jgi:hypothetical protein
MTDRARREWLMCSEWVIYIALAILAVGFAVDVFAQVSQDTINATLVERQNALSARLDKIEALLQFGIVGVFGNLIAQVFSIRTMRKG